MSNYDVIGFGAMNFDYIYKVDKIVIDGEQTIIESIAAPGGSAANTIYGLAKLNINCGFIGIVGSDENGKLLIDDLRKVGVDVNGIKISKKFDTGRTICITDKHGRRSIYVQPSANDELKYHDLKMDYVNSAKIIHMSSFVNRRQLLIQKKLMTKISSKLKISFSPGMLYVSRGLKSLLPILERTYLLFINRQEIEVLTGKDFISGAKECVGIGCKYVIVTLGHGLNLGGEKIACYIKSSENELKIKMPEILDSKFSDTTGAGDAFTAGFLYSYLQNFDISKCGLVGHVVATSIANTLGSREGFPDLEKLYYLCSLIK